VTSAAVVMMRPCWGWAACAGMGAIGRDGAALRAGGARPIEGGSKPIARPRPPFAVREYGRGALGNAIERGAQGIVERNDGLTAARGSCRYIRRWRRRRRVSTRVA
jgi:hypothetical protein